MPLCGQPGSGGALFCGSGLLRAAAAAALFCAGMTAVARAGERFDPQVREMLERAARDEEPTYEDQRTAARALRDWRLSESAAPSGEWRIGRFLDAISRGERPGDELRPVAEELSRGYLTDEGLARRLGGGSGEARRGGTSAQGGGPAGPPDAAGGWFMFAACLATFAAGVVVWMLGRRRRRPDYRAYYS